MIYFFDNFLIIVHINFLPFGCLIFDDIIFLIFKLRLIYKFICISMIEVRQISV